MCRLLRKNIPTKEFEEIIYSWKEDAKYMIYSLTRVYLDRLKVSHA